MTVAPVVVGTDGSPSASRALERAAEIADALGAEVHVVMSFERVASGALVSAAAGMGPTLVSDDLAEDHAREIVSEAARQLRLRGLAATTHVCEGEPAEALLGLADQLGAQMIVVGNRGMTGARRILGSVPNRISHRARCAVLIVPTC